MKLLFEEVKGNNKKAGHQILGLGIFLPVKGAVGWVGGLLERVPLPSLSE